MGNTEQINLFSTIKTDSIQISNFDHYLHGKVVQEYEEKFADYVGAKYALAANSESSLIFVLYYGIKSDIEIPSILPPVVANAIINGNNSIYFRDDIKWVGHSYSLCSGYILDSAQEICRNHYKTNNHSIILYSNYPTKPVAGLDGGVLVSDDKNLIDKFRSLIYNGMDTSKNSWDRKQTQIGWKMYMSTIQATVALNSLSNIEIKKEKLEKIRKKYNNSFSLLNTSDHLYRVKVQDNIKVLEELKEKGILCGIHYKPLHKQLVFYHYTNHKTNMGGKFPLSEEAGKTMLSIPFHEDLSESDVDRIINEVSTYVI